MQPIFSKSKKAREQKFVKKFGAVQPRRQYTEALTSAILGIILAFTVFIFGGGLYDLLQRPPPIGMGLGSNWSFYVPYDLSVQYLNESIFFMIFLCIGLAGAFLISRSLKQSSSQRSVSMFLVGSLAVFILGVLGAYLLMWMKAPGA